MGIAIENCVKMRGFGKEVLEEIICGVCKEIQENSVRDRHLV